MASFMLLGGEASPVPTHPQSMLSACPPAPQFWPPPPHTHWIVGTGEPEAWQGRSRGCPTRVVTGPKPSANRSCGGTVGRGHHWVSGAEEIPAYSPPKSQCHQSQAQASPHPSSTPINGPSSRRPSRTTQVQPPHRIGLFIQCLPTRPRAQESRLPVPCLIQG